jgi:hypothetical protein
VANAENEDDDGKSWLAEQIERVAQLTAAAGRELGLSDLDADQMASGGSVSLSGLEGTVKVLPIRDTAPSSVAPVLITLDTRQALATIGPAHLRILLAMAPALGALQASIGCDAAGSLCLFRVVKSDEMTASGIAKAFRHAWHLALLVWGEEPNSSGAQS